MAKEKSKKEIEMVSREKLEEFLQYVSDRCREEAEEANTCKIGFGTEAEDILNEALGTFFEKMSEIIEEAISSTK